MHSNIDLAAVRGQTGLAKLFTATRSITCSEFLINRAAEVYTKRTSENLAKK